MSLNFEIVVENHARDFDLKVFQYLKLYDILGKIICLGFERCVQICVEVYWNYLAQNLD